MAQITFNFNTSKFTAAAWAGYIRMHPIPTDDQGAPLVDTSTDALKLAYITSVCKRQLAFDVRRGMDLNARDQAPRSAADFDVTE